MFPIWLLGVLLAITASVVSNLGLNLQVSFLSIPNQTTRQWLTHHTLDSDHSFTFITHSHHITYN